MSPADALLQISGLRVSYGSAAGGVQAVRGVDLQVLPGETVAVVGESGSGKSTTAHAVLGLLDAGGTVDGGSIRLDGLELVGLPDKAWPRVRGRVVALVPQDPTVSLNPVRTIGSQLAEVLLAHGLADRRTARTDAVDLLERVGLPDPAARAGQYAHELSGGMRQRALIALALAGRPRLIVADEPTSALDVTVQRRILDLLDEVIAESGSSLLLITHDLAVAADRADRVVVMKDGRIVESGPTAGLLSAPRDPYTRRLLDAVPGLHLETRTPPPDRPVEPLVEVRDLVKDFSLPRGAAERAVRAVDSVSFDIGRGQTFGLVGESGSGKSTAARLVLGLTEPTAGTVSFDGEDITRARGARARALRRRAQMVYQNPYASLDPRHSVAQIVAEPLRVFGIGDRRSRRLAAAELIDQVALPVDVLARRPRELSGGQRQRVAIARALALRPDLVVCDEPTSALDVSVQAGVLELLVDLQQQHGLTYLFISHDLAVVRQIAHRVGVMSQGALVEVGSTVQVFEHPRHPYTRELLAAIPGQTAQNSYTEPAETSS